MSQYPPLTNAFLVLTNQCNLACRYCFVAQNKSEMSLDVAMDAVKYLAKNGIETGRVPNITFFGGEPTLRFDDIIVPVVNYIRQEWKRPFNISITTNGLLLTAERLHWMRKNKIGVLFSIDGAKETQDYNRPFHSGRGSFNALENTIEQITTFYPNVMFRSTVIPATVHHLYENILFAENHDFKNIYEIPNVYEEWSDEATATLKDELRKYGDHVIEAFRSNVPYIKLMPFERAFGKMWRINNTRDRRNTIDCLAQGKCGFCTNGGGAIDVHGNIYACQELPSSHGTEDPFCIGNIYDGIDEDKHQRLLSMYDVQAVRGADCEQCKLRDICDGGCVANNYMLNGSMNIMAPIYCLWNQMLVDEAHRVATILGNEENEIFREHFRKLVREGGYGL